MNHKAYRLMLITQLAHHALTDYLHFIENCAASGITSVQLREKNLPFPKLLHFAKKLQQVLTPLQIPLIINDHLEVAKFINADGLHLGQQDAEVHFARSQLGPHKAIGLSIESEKELEFANQSAILTYVAASAIFPTQNKNNLKKFWGIQGLQTFVKNSAHPVIAIGGINIKNINNVMRTGVAGVAVIGAIHQANSPNTACKQLRNIIDEYIV